MGRYIRSPIDAGSDGIIVEIECHVSNGLPAILIVGLGGKAVDEAKERLRSAFSSAKVPLPRKRITINLAPADVPKQGASLDLAMAGAIIDAGPTNMGLAESDAIIGELGLDGSVRPVRGIIGKLLIGKRAGIRRFFIPQNNLHQAMLVPDIQIVPVESLEQLAAFMQGKIPATVNSTSESTNVPKSKEQKFYPIDDVAGQELAKRAIEIAAAGGHNLLLNGPPGTGKSMLAKAVPSLLPPLGQEEVLEVTHLHSLTNGDYDKLVTQRPFRAPHHSSSQVALIGGGHTLRPGEVSLSHRGVLFFDELPEFGRSAIEALRQPLEDRRVTIARAKHSVTYPAHFILIATANPCPCGYFGTSNVCRCSAHVIQQYQQRVSGPILDRFDLHVNVDRVEYGQLLADHTKNQQGQKMHANIASARSRQKLRFGSTARLNGDMSNRDVKTKVTLSPEARNILDTASERLQISARSYMKIIKVAQTIADLNEAPAISTEHIAEALQYRPQRPHLA